MQRFSFSVGILVTFLLASCAIPTTQDTTNFKCIKFKEDFILARSVNTCPLLVNSPQPMTSHWEFYEVDENIKANIEESKKFKYKLRTKSCELPTNIREYKTLTLDTTLSVTKVITRNDTVRFNRMFIYGTLEDANGNLLEWIYEPLNNEVHDTNSRIFEKFEVCSVET